MALTSYNDSIEDFINCFNKYFNFNNIPPNASLDDLKTQFSALVDFCTNHLSPLVDRGTDRLYLADRGTDNHQESLSAFFTNSLINLFHHFKATNKNFLLFLLPKLYTDVRVDEFIPYSFPLIKSKQLSRIIDEHLSHLLSTETRQPVLSFLRASFLFSSLWNIIDCNESFKAYMQYCILEKDEHGRYKVYDAICFSYTRYFSEEFSIKLMSKILNSCADEVVKKTLYEIWSCGYREDTNVGLSTYINPKLLQELDGLRPPSMIHIYKILNPFKISCAVAPPQVPTLDANVKHVYLDVHPDECHPNVLNQIVVDKIHSLLKFYVLYLSNTQIETIDFEDSLIFHSLDDADKIKNILILLLLFRFLKRFYIEFSDDYYKQSDNIATKNVQQSVGRFLGNMRIATDIQFSLWRECEMRRAYEQQIHIQRARHTALFTGLHPRCGTASPVSLLSQNFVKQICTEDARQELLAEVGLTEAGLLQLQRTATLSAKQIRNRSKFSIIVVP